MNGLQVKFVDAEKFRPNGHNFKEILGGLAVKSDDKIAEITCGSVMEAKELQRGFHSSGTGRRYKREGWKIETTRIDKKVQVRLSKVEIKKAS